MHRVGLKAALRTFSPGLASSLSCLGSCPSAGSHSQGSSWTLFPQASPVPSALSPAPPGPFTRLHSIRGPLVHACPSWPRARRHVRCAACLCRASPATPGLQRSPQRGSCGGRGVREGSAPCGPFRKPTWCLCRDCVGQEVRTWAGQHWLSGSCRSHLGPAEAPPCLGGGSALSFSGAFVLARLVVLCGDCCEGSCFLCSGFCPISSIQVVSVLMSATAVRWPRPVVAHISPLSWSFGLFPDHPAVGLRSLSPVGGRT